MRQGMFPQSQQQPTNQPSCGIGQQPQNSQQNINPNNQSASYSVPKKPQFYQAAVNNSSYISQSEKQQQQQFSQKQMMQHQQIQYQQKTAQIDSTTKLSGLPKGSGKYMAPQSQNVSHHYQFQTPTHQQQQQNQVLPPQVIIDKVVQQNKKKKNKKYQLIVKVSEANLFISKTKFFQMSVFVKLKINKKEEKTQNQNGQNPKWNETFVFENIEKKNQIEFSVYHKSLFSAEELIGNAIFIFQELYPYNLKQFITLYDGGKAVGGLHINLNVVKSKQDSQGAATNDAEDSNSKSNEENDVDEELMNSIDYRDQEVQRQLLPPRGRQGGLPIVPAAGVRSNAEYKALQTQQQVQAQSAYLNTQMNQPRQSVTESSMIQHYSNTNSSNNSDNEAGAGDSGKPKRKHRHRHHHHHHHKHNHNSRVNQAQQQLFPQSTIEEEQIVPQQLFYGKSGNHHSNSSNNLLNLPNQVPNKYQQQQQQQHSNSQFLYLQDLSANMGYHQASKKQQHKSKKEKSSKRKEHMQMQQQQQQPLIQVDHFLDELVEQQDLIEQEEDVNYGHYLNQRAGEMNNNFGGTAIAMMGNGSNGQQISASQSQQLLSGINKQQHLVGFDSGGGTSGSGGVQQMYGGMGPTGYNMGAGSNGSQFPMCGPSYFEEQNSIESLNDVIDPQSISGNQHMILQQNITQGMFPQYDISEFQEIEQRKLDLMEENDRIHMQDLRLKMMFEKYQIELQKLQNVKHETRKQKELLKVERKRLISQKEEYDYQKQQMERGYVGLKQNKEKLTQQTMVLEDLNKQFTECIKEGKLLQQAQGTTPSEKIEEFINLMKGIHYMLQQLINMQQNNRSQSRMEEQKMPQQNNMLSHIQQESTSSCATNSTGNYNFLLQGSSLFHPKLLSNQSPIHQQNIKGNSQNPNNPQKQINTKAGGAQQQSLSNNQSRSHLGVASSQPESISPPKVITDIINTEEDEIIDGLADQDLRLSPQIINESELEDYGLNNKDAIMSGKQFKNQQSASVGRSGIQYKGGPNGFLHEQHELSTIMEREMTSQRRSSNGGMAPNTTMEGRQAPSTAIGNQFMAQASAFQMLNGDSSNPAIDDEEELARYNLYVTHQQQQQQQQQQYQKQVNKAAQNKAYDSQKEEFSREKQLLQDEKKAYEERKLQLDNLYQDLYKELENIQMLKQGMLNNIGIDPFLLKQQQQQQQIHINHETGEQIQQQLLQEEFKQEDHNTIIGAEIVHITASDMKNNNSLPQQQYRPIAQHNPHEESLQFIPDPDFLSKINQNMQHNDRFFDGQGKLVQNSDIQPNNLFYDDDYDNDYSDHDDHDHEGAQHDYEEEVGHDNHSQGQEEQEVVEVPQNIFLDDPDEMMIQTVHNRSTQGQGEGKRVYIQDDFGDLDIHVTGANQNIVEGQPFERQLEDDAEDEEEKYGTIQRVIQVNSDSNKKSGDQKPIQLILKSKKDKLTDEEIQKLIDENYMYEENSKDSSVIYYNGKVYDEKKRAIYGIQKCNAYF